MTEPAPHFHRIFRGYDPAAVDAHIELLTTKQQFLLDDVESLRARLKDSSAEAAALRKEVTVLTDTSSSPHAIQQRMANILRRAVDDATEMRADAQAEAAALVASAEAEVAATRRKHEALEARYDETKEKLEAEASSMRADAEQQREQLLADAKQEAEHYREQVKLEVDEASRQRLKVLEQLMGVYRDLEAVPAALQSAYQEIKAAPEASAVDRDDPAS